jgi:hypothetical protein
VARQLTFSEEERARLAKICQILGTTFEQFCHFSVLQAMDECEAIGRDVEAVKRYYEDHE